MTVERGRGLQKTPFAEDNAQERRQPVNWDAVNTSISVKIVQEEVKIGYIREEVSLNPFLCWVLCFIPANISPNSEYCCGKEEKTGLKIEVFNLNRNVS